MVFVLDKIEDMKAIYESAKKVYNREIAVSTAVKDLTQKIGARDSSLQMYLNIYACMRKGKTYKMGTSESFTQFLLEQILHDEGADAFELALKAVKGNAIYRESKNNAQPGLRRACINAIGKSGLSIDYDSISVDERGETMEYPISENDLIRLKQCIGLPNADFAKIIMEMLEKYQVLSDEEIISLTDQAFCSSNFRSSFPMLKAIDPGIMVEEQIRDASGRNRYYGSTYTLRDKTFSFTSQLYGLGSSPTTRDNRTPFLGWVLAKFGVEQSKTGWWPSHEEYPLNLTKEDWKQYILEVEMPNHPSPMKMLKGMLELGGEASCKLLSDTYGGHPSVYAGCAMNLGRRVKKYFDLPACMDGDQERYFPFPFVGKYQGSSQDNYLYKIRPELFDALNEIDLSSINPNYEEDHKLGTFDSWEIIDENTAIKHCDKSFFDYRGSGVPKGICWFFGAEDMNLGETKIVKLIYNGKQYQGSVKNESSDRRRVRIFWSTELGGLFDAFNVPDATATFKKIADDTYEVSIKGGEKEMTIKEKMAAIKAYIAARGFNYEGDLIENFYLSLKSKPFIILAGTSGTGKTKLVEYFAEAIDAPMHLVPVRPDWSDSSDLFGHKDLSGDFHPGAIIDFLKAAMENPSAPHFLCLDEMNLARVEYYMSDLLSIIETRNFNEQHRIVTRPLIGKDYCRCSNGCNDYGEMGIPENLYIIGTVNMDETTFPFSKKVLDRANTIEFSYVDLLSMPSFSTEPVPKVAVDNDFLASKYITLNDCDAADKAYISGVCTTLSRVNGILEMANAHIGYRVRDEIVFYMLNNKKADLLDEKVAFDNQIMQKILPRIQGSSESIKKMLEELLKICDSEKFEASAKKINFMIKRYDEDGFTSYWL